MAWGIFTGGSPGSRKLVFMSMPPPPSNWSPQPQSGLPTSGPQVPGPSWQAPQAPQIHQAPQMPEPSWQAPQASWQAPGGGYPQPPAGMTQSSNGGYASWGKRVAAAIMDSVFSCMVLAPIWIVVIVLTFISETAAAGVGYLAQFVGFGLSVFWWIKTGTVGQSPGKKFVGIKVVGTETGTPIGGGRSILRQFAHIVDAIICYIGFLLPLFDSKKQTIADKIMSTVVVPVPKAGFMESFKSGFKKD